MSDHDLEAVRHALAPRYQLDRELASGGMATIYLATDPRHGRQVAIKVYRPEIPSPRGLTRFLREIRVTASLSHPHVLPLLDSGQTEDFTYYVMPYVKGESLRERIGREKQLPVDDIVRLVAEIASALDAAHEAGIVHRDIKPGNILLEQGHAVVADFGIGRAVAELGGDTVTAAGVTIGTPLYMSPEQASGEGEVDARADIYSLACVAYEMLTGEPPFTGPTAQIVIAKKLSQTPLSITTYRGALPAQLDAPIRRALARSSVDRFSSAGEFAGALRDAARAEVELASHLRRRSTVLAVLAAAAVSVTAALSLADDPAWWPSAVTAQETFVILPFHVPATSAVEDSLASAIVDELTRQVNSWDGVIAIPQVSLTGPMFDLGLEGPSIERVSDGIRIARELRATRLVGLSADVRSDSVWITATFFDAERDELVGQPLIYVAPADDLFQLAAPSAARIVGLDASPSSLALAARYTRSPEAFGEFQMGRALLDQWRLDEAEARFRQAIESDSLFSMAQHYLALSLYWQTARDPRALGRLGPEIGRHTQAAVLNSADLSDVDRRHVEAFHAFQHGDYERAREAYHALLSRDSADVNAWLLLGGVEYFDPWLERTPAGRFVPRSNLNVALRAFINTVSLSPSFHLGYGHLFDIHDLVAAAVSRGVSPRFEIPRDELIAPWESGNPSSQQTRFPVFVDSIVWMEAAAFRSLGTGVAQRGAARLEEQVGRLLRRWVAFAPDAGRPHEQMASWVTAQLARIALPAPPSRIDSLVATARNEALLALELSNDTLPTDLFRLAELQLASRNVDEALRLLGLGLGRMSRNDPDRRLAANVLMATGQSDALLRLYDGQSSSRTRYAPAPDGRLIPYGSSLGLIDRMEALGATGIDGGQLHQAVDELTETWRSSGHSADDQLVLRRNATQYVAGAIVLDSAILRNWIATIGTTTDPALLGILHGPADPMRARRHLTQAEQAQTDGRPDARESYLIALGWQILGDHTAAARWFTRLDSLPLSVGVLDSSWGYRTLSLARRALSFEALADTAAAVASRARFRAIWRGPDSIIPPRTGMNGGSPAARDR